MTLSGRATRTRDCQSPGGPGQACGERPGGRGGGPAGAATVTDGQPGSTVWAGAHRSGRAPQQQPPQPPEPRLRLVRLGVSNGACSESFASLRCLQWSESARPGAVGQSPGPGSPPGPARGAGGAAPAPPAASQSVSSGADSGRPGPPRPRRRGPGMVGNLNTTQANRSESVRRSLRLLTGTGRLGRRRGLTRPGSCVRHAG